MLEILKEEWRWNGNFIRLSTKFNLFFSMTNVISQNNVKEHVRRENRRIRRMGTKIRLTTVEIQFLQILQNTSERVNVRVFFLRPSHKQTSDDRSPFEKEKKEK